MTVTDNELRSKSILANPGENAPGMNDYEIAKLWGVSHSRVYQIRLRAMKKLRAAILADPELRTLASEACGLELSGETT